MNNTQQNQTLLDTKQALEDYLIEYPLLDWNNEHIQNVKQWFKSIMTFSFDACKKTLERHPGPIAGITHQFQPDNQFRINPFVRPSKRKKSPTIDHVTPLYLSHHEASGKAGQNVRAKPRMYRLFIPTNPLAQKAIPNNHTILQHVKELQKKIDSFSHKGTLEGLSFDATNQQPVLCFIEFGSTIMPEALALVQIRPSQHEINYKIQKSINPHNPDNKRVPHHARRTYQIVRIDRLA